MDPYGFSAAAVLAAAQLSGTEAALAAPEVNGIDFSLAAMFMRATAVVKITMILLVLASFWSWAIIFERVLVFRRLTGQSTRFEDEFWSGKPLDQLFDRVGGSPQTPIEQVFSTGMTEWRRSLKQEGGLIPGTQARVDRAMNVAIARASELANRRLSYLATVGSVSPFVGLFGTVWGIKHSFESIAVQQNTNLAVVAPGIAEALLATALGLLAAIPAVVAYNRLSTDADRMTGALENFADEFSTILGRQIDRQSGGK
jgi:biopolymer transport protein TolQ